MKQPITKGFIKITITALLIFSVGICFGQNYKLFNASTKKLFTDYPIPLSAYSISFNNAMQNGNDSVYFNFFELESNAYFSDTCDFWGPSVCYKQNVPSWIGKKIIYDNAFVYNFFNWKGDTLKFEFKTNFLDTLVFYKDSIQKFQFLYYKSDTLMVLNHLDSAYFYKIIHTDNYGNSLNSNLNQQEIIISKNWGLMRFFRVDSFPQILKPLALIGNVSPDAGFYAITNENLYDYQPGDVIQYKDYSNQAGGPPSMNYTKYKKYTILSRTLTVDSIIYNTIYEYFYSNSSVLYKDTFDIKYFRKEVLAKIPFELFNGKVNELKTVDYCSQKFWTYTINSQNYTEFCSQDTCWGSEDTNGPPPIISEQYALGLGKFKDTYSYPLSPPYGYYKSSQIVYFRKNGLHCGTEILLGINENYIDNRVLCYPNPATNQVNISFKEIPQANIDIQLFDITGRLLKSKRYSSQINIDIDVNDLTNGIYFLNINTAEGYSKTFKIIKE